MDPENVKNLADALKDYFSQYELEDLCRRFGVVLNYSGTSPNLRRLAGDILSNPQADQNRQFLHTLISELLERCQEQIQNTTREDNLYHKQMILQLNQLKQSLSPDKAGAPVPESLPESGASIRSNLAEFFGRADTAVTVVDADSAAGTLDCLQKVAHPIRLLTKEPSGGFDQNFIRVLKTLNERGKTIEMRLHPDIHDRVILFDHRCWLAGGPLKDAANASFTLIEVIDNRDAISDRVENMWLAAELLIIG
ncbi:MAG: hypothetical protein ABF303_00670 [Desulfobacterales bacterium]|jgi:hypothetical protein